MTKQDYVITAALDLNSYLKYHEMSATNCLVTYVCIVWQYVTIIMYMFVGVHECVSVHVHACV